MENEWSNEKHQEVGDDNMNVLKKVGMSEIGVRKWELRSLGYVRLVSGQDLCTQSTCVCKDAMKDSFKPFLENPNVCTLHCFYTD